MIPSSCALGKGTSELRVQRGDQNSDPIRELIHYIGRTIPPVSPFCQSSSDLLNPALPEIMHRAAGGCADDGP